jgi:hypothetical protein
VKAVLFLSTGLLLGLPGGVAGAERLWDQAAAKKLVAKVLEVEKTKARPWNKIPWRILTSSAVAEASKSGKPIFSFYFMEEDGPPEERCCPEGRLIRTLVLSDPNVSALIKENFIPVKLKLEKGKDFPVEWPALKAAATGFEFSNGKGFAGCSVVSFDLAVEYGNGGSAKIWEVFSSTAYDPKKFAEMLERAVSRLTEERSLRVQRGISEAERKQEVYRFRLGISHAVRAEGRAELPPKGYSLERALELYRMAGAVEISPEKE